MAEEEGGIIHSDVAMSTSDHAAADSEEGALSDVMSQHTENKGGGSEIVESIDVVADVEDNVQQKIFQIEPELELDVVEKSIESKSSEAEVIDDNASKDSDGQLTTDNEEEDQMDNYIQNQISNGLNYDANETTFNQPLNAYNGNLEYTISQNLLMDGEGLENRLLDMRHNIQHLFNQMNNFNDRLTDSENFDIDEFGATFLELSSLYGELCDICREFDELHEKISSEALTCLDKYEENANICGGHLLNAKLNKARLIREIIKSWHRRTEIYEAHIVEDMNSDEEIEPNPYYDNVDDFQIFSCNIPTEPTGYTYVADIPPPTLPTTFFVEPTAIPSFSSESIQLRFNENDSDNERTTELPTDLLSSYSMASLPISNAPEHPPSSPINFIPPMISQASSSSFNTPAVMSSSNTLPSMNVPPPAMALPPQTIPSLQSNILSQSNIISADPKVVLPPFQSKQQMPPKPASVLIPGLNIANTAPLFAQASNSNNSLLSEQSLIQAQIPAATSSGSGMNNFGADNFRKQNPQIAPIINLNMSTMGSKSPAQNPIVQSSSSSHIPSLLSIEVPFPIEILKRNQNQAQQQRFNNRSRRSPVVNTETKESTVKEKESQSVKSDEAMDTTEQPIMEETPDDPINDTPGS
uniref:Uncharacterized protein n=1 Tax=Panagrolaimus sp. ES5 TaxID=591445 RepID=A0AC34F6C7_9BILA